MFDLKQRRKELGLTLEEIGDIVGVGKSTVRKWENGQIDNMKRDKIALLAKALHISPLDIIYDMESSKVDPDITTIYNQLEPPRQKKVYSFAKQELEEQKDNVVNFPVPGATAAGTSPIAYGDIDVEEKEFTYIPRGADIALNVKGDSMEPLISDGSIVFYKSQPNVENGEIAIVEIEGDGVTCKRVKFDYDNEKIILQSENDKYEDMVFNNEQIRILGKVLL